MKYGETFFSFKFNHVLWPLVFVFMFFINSNANRHSVLNKLESLQFAFISCIIFRVTNSLTYYGLNLISSTLYGNRFLNFFFLGAIEYVSALTEFLLLNRWTLWINSGSWTNINIIKSRYKSPNCLQLSNTHSWAKSFNQIC